MSCANVSHLRAPRPTRRRRAALSQRQRGFEWWSARPASHGRRRARPAWAAASERPGPDGVRSRPCRGTPRGRVRPVWRERGTVCGVGHRAPRSGPRCPAAGAAMSESGRTGGSGSVARAAVRRSQPSRVFLALLASGRAGRSYRSRSGPRSCRLGSSSVSWRGGECGSAGLVCRSLRRRVPPSPRRAISASICSRRLCSVRSPSPSRVTRPIAWESRTRARSWRAAAARLNCDEQQRFLHRLGQVVPHVPAVGDLDRVRCTSTGRLGVRAGVIAADHPGFRVRRQPLDHGVRSPIREDLDRSVGTYIDQHGGRTGVGAAERSRRHRAPRLCSATGPAGRGPAATRWNGRCARPE